MPNGASGFTQGLMAGMPYGQMLGNAIAQRRSAGRISDLQDQIDSGQLDPNTAAGQLAIQQATRAAQQPLAERGLDTSYGDEQYNRLAQQGILRSAQAGGQQIKDGDVSGGLTTQAGGLLSAGQIDRGVQGMGYAGQVKAGEDSIDANGTLNLERLDQGTARNAAMMGNPAGAQQWNTQQKSDHQSVVNNMAGRIMLQAKTNGLESVMPQVAALAKMTGMGEAHYSPEQKKIYLLDDKGEVNAAFGAEDLDQFASHAATNPDNVIGAYQGYQAAQAKQTADLRTDIIKKGVDTNLDIAKGNWQNPQAAAIRAQVGQLTGAAKAAGWDIDTGTKQQAMDSSGAPIEGLTSYTVKTPHGGEPLTMQVDTRGAKPVTKFYTAEGQEVPPQTLVAAGSGAQIAARAAEMDAYADAHAATMAQRQQAYSDVGGIIQGAMGAVGGGPTPSDAGAMGRQPAAMPKGGAPGAGATKAPSIQQLQNSLKAVPYKSPYAALNNAQFMQESSGDQGAVSSKGARGVAQLMPDTARELEQRYGMPAGITDSNPVASLYAGQRYRDELIDGYKQAGHPEQEAVALGLAAYNWGPGNVAKFLQGKAQMPAETRNYLAVTMPAWEQAQQRQAAPAPAPMQSSTPMISVGGQQITNPFAAVSTQRG